MTKTGNIEQMLKEFSDGTYDLTDNGKCTQCGNCVEVSYKRSKDECFLLGKEWYK